MFVIAITAKPLPQHGAKQKFLAYDAHSGGYPHWTENLSAAHMFSSLEKAQKEINGSDFTKPTKMSDGKIYPPMMIHSGLDLNNSLVENSGELGIYELTLKPAVVTKIQSKLNLGVDEAIMRENALNKLTPAERALLNL